jgi:hypothetical protein
VRSSNATTNKDKRKNRQRKINKGAKHQPKTPTKEQKEPEWNRIEHEGKAETNSICSNCTQIILRDCKFCPECGTKSTKRTDRHNLGPKLEALLIQQDRRPPGDAKQIKERRNLQRNQWNPKPWKAPEPGKEEVPKRRC